MKKFTPHFFYKNNLFFLRYMYNLNEFKYIQYYEGSNWKQLKNTCYNYYIPLKYIVIIILIGILIFL